MNRRALLAAALALGTRPALALTGRFTRGVLWRIAHADTSPSHLYGTIHDGDASVAALAAPALVAFTHSRSLMVEFLPDAYSAERFTEAAMFADGRTLEELIGAEDFARVLEALAPIGLTRDVVNKLKPWGALINLRQSGVSAAPGVDRTLLEQARVRRMRVQPMEDVEEQIFSFDECPLASQVALLKHSVAHRDELVQLAERTRLAYVARDLEAIWRLREDYMARYPEVAEHQAILTKRLLYDRSVVMAYRMQRELRRGGAFAAIGALHLYGDKGVLALLEADGYRGSRVY